MRQRRQRLGEQGIMAGQGGGGKDGKRGVHGGGKFRSAARLRHATRHCGKENGPCCASRSCLFLRGIADKAPRAIRRTYFNVPPIPIFVSPDTVTPGATGGPSAPQPARAKMVGAIRARINSGFMAVLRGRARALGPSRSVSASLYQPSRAFQRETCSATRTGEVPP